MGSATGELDEKAMSLDDVRRFEHPDGRYWIVANESSATLRIRWGKPGSEQTVSRPFYSTEERDAKRTTDIARQLAAGFVEVAVVPPPAAPPPPVEPVVLEIEPHETSNFGKTATWVASNPELEAACRAAPDDAETFAVYADWLLAQGDLRGEIAAHFQRDPRSIRGTDLVNLNRRALYGDDLGRRTKPTRWKFGFPVAAELGYSNHYQLGSIVNMFANAPFTQFVDELVLGPARDEPPNDWEPALRVLAESPLAPHLRVLRLDTEDRHADFGDLVELAAWFPKLEELALASDGNGSIGPLPQSLRRLKLAMGPLGYDLWAPVLRQELPVLESLELSLGFDDNHSELLELLEPLLALKHAPALRHLALRGYPSPQTLIPTLVGTPLLARLRSLDLRSIGNLEAVLAPYTDRFAHLERFDRDL
ncbi:MAG: hypothetical protein QM831_32435 [Kofleriaceae bacterium]